MSQDDVFYHGEGDRWFDRNRAALTAGERPDWPLRLVSMLEDGERLASFLELGCSNGWRLARLQGVFGKHRRYVGVDAAEAPLDAGRAAFPGLELHRGLLSEIPLEGAFDLVIVNFVLHWVDRLSLARSIAEIDRLVADGGYLVVGDFLPDAPQRVPYHHLPGKEVFTYKQDYARAFTALGTYGERIRIAHEHAGHEDSVREVRSGDRAATCLLHKSLHGFYSGPPT